MVNKALTVAQIFVNQFECHFGSPQYLHTDQGHLESCLLKETCILYQMGREAFPMVNMDTDKVNMKLLELTIQFDVWTRISCQWISCLD